MEGLTQSDAAVPRVQSGNPHGAGYTGVLVVHGVGADRRNEALQTYINALAYWFNHVAQLASRPWGTGRVWVRTQLIDDNRPDAESSRATIEVVAPADLIAAASDQSLPTELQFREIWWARSFGVPSAAAGLQVVRTMYREELFRVLSAWLLHRGRRQHSTYHQAPPDTPARRIMKAILRFPQRILIMFYELVQELWKLGQWLVSIPFAFGLLFLLGLARLLQPLPGVGSIVSAIGGTFSTLDWMASVHVYLVDYTRSVAMRCRFELELADLLADPSCERIVVLGHSMGTIIAYEGLTDVLARQADAQRQKPITFVSLGQVLRHVWHMPLSDTRRLRGALPEMVRWVNFYARYDPISAGSLDTQALPPVRSRSRSDAEPSSADDAVRASLARCENHLVANRDSLIFDHVTYFNNLEQVIGPIARELVAGHPALEMLTTRHLATKDEVLQRRWSIAWRSGIPLAAGVWAGVETLLLGMRYDFGMATRTLVGEILAGGGALPGFIGLLWRLAGQLIGWLAGGISDLIAAILRAAVGGDRAGMLTRQMGVAIAGATDVVILILAIVLVTALVVMLAGQILAPSLPYKFKTPFQRSRQRRARAQPAALSQSRERVPVAFGARQDTDTR